MLEFCDVASHLPFFQKQTRTTFRKLVELDLLVLSFIHNYDLLKYHTINQEQCQECFRLKSLKKNENIQSQFSLS